MKFHFNPGHSFLVIVNWSLRSHTCQSSEPTSTCMECVSWKSKRFRKMDAVLEWYVGLSQNWCQDDCKELLLDLSSPSATCSVRVIGYARRDDHVTMCSCADPFNNLFPPLCRFESHSFCLCNTHDVSLQWTKTSHLCNLYYNFGIGHECKNE